MPVCRLAAVLVLVIVLILVVVLILVIVLILIVVLVLVLLIHNGIPPLSFCDPCREISLPQNLRFILIFEDQACQQSTENRHCNTACRGLQSTGQHTKEALFLYSFLYALG